MKKIFLILLMAPLLMATQCDEDDEILFQTEFVIQNDSNTDLTITVDPDIELALERQSGLPVWVAFDARAAITPTENTNITEIKLYKKDDEGNEVLAYDQDPIVNNLWVFTEDTPGDYKYTLVITDDLLD
jgi:hypothetical protein